MKKRKSGPERIEGDQCGALGGATERVENSPVLHVLVMHPRDVLYHFRDGT